jgi:Zn-dependent M28 family amino/carboxypeptidase
VFLLFSGCSSSNSAANEFDGERAFRDLESLLKIGRRVSGTAGSQMAQKLIIDKLEGAGLKIEEYGFKAMTPLGVIEMNNIVGIVEGTEPGVIILSNHYDSKYFPDFEFVGANDGGSTTAWMLEMARTMGPKRDGYTLWLTFFDGEEAFQEWSDTDSLYGSREMVQKLRSLEKLSDVKACINLDMIGDKELGILRDTDAPEWLRKPIWDSAKNLGYGTHFLRESRYIEDDHLPFRRAGIPAINLIDFKFGGGSRDHDRNWHTPNDTLDKVSPDSLQIVGEVLLDALPDIESTIRRMDSRN